VFEHLLQARRSEIAQNLEQLQPIPPQTRRAVQLARWNQVGDLLRAWRQHGYTICLHHRKLTPPDSDDELIHALEASFKVTEDARLLVLARSGDQAELAQSIENAVLEMEAVADLIPFNLTEVRNFAPVGQPRERATFWRPDAGQDQLRLGRR
jgi:hypothetical protein